MKLVVAIMVLCILGCVICTGVGLGYAAHKSTAHVAWYAASGVFGLTYWILSFVFGEKLLAYLNNNG